MDLQEQNKFAVELEKFVLKQLKNQPFHLIISVETNPGTGFTFPISTLDKRTSFESCDIVISGIAEESRAVVNKFDIPSYPKLKKPVEFK